MKKFRIRFPAFAAAAPLVLLVAGCGRDTNKDTAATIQIKASLSGYQLTAKEMGETVPQHVGKPNMNALYDQVRKVAAPPPKGKQLNLDPKVAPLDWQAIREFVAASKTQIALAEEIAAHPDLSTRRIWKNLLSMSIPEYGAMRAAARILVMQALVKFRDQGRVAGLNLLLPITNILTQISYEPIGIGNGTALTTERDIFNAIQVMIGGAPILDSSARSAIRAILDRLPPLKKPGQFIISEAIGIEPYAAQPAELLRAIGMPNNRTSGLDYIPEINQPSPERLTHQLWKDVKTIVNILDADGKSVIEKLKELETIEGVISSDRDSARAASRALSGVHSSYLTQVNRMVIRDLLRIVSSNHGGTLPLDPYANKPYSIIEKRGVRTIYSFGPDLTDNGGSISSKPSDGSDRTAADIGIQFNVPLTKPKKSVATIER